MTQSFASLTLDRLKPALNQTAGTMFANLKAVAFNDPDFKEDSVRELVVVPILSRLGYLPLGEARVLRSKTLRLLPLTEN